MAPRKRKFVRRTRRGGEVLTSGKRRRIMAVKIVKPRRRLRGQSRAKSGIVPDRKVVRMRYYFENTLDISSVFKQHVYHANGIFDPDVTGVGHQPRGHDQYAVLYNDYVVLGSKITINGFSPGNAEPWMLSVQSEESATATTADPEAVVELPGGSFSIKSAFKETRKSVKLAVNIGSFLNRKRLADDSDLVAAFGASPSTPVFFRIMASPIGAGASASVRLIGWIDYRVMLLNPVKVVES